MSTDHERLPGETKGEHVKRLVEASQTAVQRENYDIIILKDVRGLTKILVQPKIQERTDGGRAEAVSSI